MVKKAITNDDSNRNQAAAVVYISYHLAYFVGLKNHLARKKLNAINELLGTVSSRTVDDKVKVTEDEMPDLSSRIVLRVFVEG